MAVRKKVRVIRESETGRNERFQDIRTEASMTRTQFVREIEAGNYPTYHVREINGKATPVSNPDSSTRNNLG